jgi:hypothetical protein
MVRFQKVIKKSISQLTRIKRTSSAAATVQVSHVLLAVRFSCLLRGQFPRWRRTKLTLPCNHRSGHLKTEHTETGPAVNMISELLEAQEKLGQLPLLAVYVLPV